MENLKKQDAAQAIQKVVRGHKSRKATPAIIEEILTNNKKKELQQKVQAAQITQQTLDDAMKQLVKEDTAATSISSAFKGHKGRKEYNYIKKYPQEALKRQLEVSSTKPSTELQKGPKTSYLQNVNTKISNIRNKYEKALLKHSVLNTDLQITKADNVAAVKSLVFLFSINRALTFHNI